MKLNYKEWIFFFKSTLLNILNLQLMKVLNFLAITNLTLKEKPPAIAKDACVLAELKDCVYTRPT